jgi:hypothetical protein
MQMRCWNATYPSNPRRLRRHGRERGIGLRGVHIGARKKSVVFGGPCHGGLDGPGVVGWRYQRGRVVRRRVETKKLLRVAKAVVPVPTPQPRPT